MAEYIEREELVSDLEFLARHQDGFRQSVILGVVHTIKCVPAVDVAPVVHGKWVFDHTYTGKHKEVYVCSVCNHYQSARKGHEPSKNTMYMRFCPYCGARMDGE